MQIDKIERERLVIEGEENILTPVRISGGLPKPIEAYVSVPPKMPAKLPQGSYSYSIKLKGYFWPDGKAERRWRIESNEVILRVEKGGPTPTPTPTKRTPGFETIFALIGIIIVAYLVRKDK